MKKLSIILSLLISITFTVKAEINNTAKIHRQQVNVIDSLPCDSLTNYLRQIAIANFYGTPVDSFLAAIPNIPVNMFVSSCKMGRVSMYNACYLQVSYCSDLVIRIYVQNFTHMNPYSATLNWNINLFRQENIHKISVFKDNKCINGLCKNP